MNSGDKKFKVITNNDIYAELQEQRKLLESSTSKLNVHDEQITNIKKVAYATAGSLVTFAVGFIVYVLTRGIIK